MSFSKLALSGAFAGQQIATLSEAQKFLDRLDLPRQDLPHWQMARQGLFIAAASEGADDLAWREFRNALQIEGWLTE